jgi:hypothetical protein
LSASTERFAIVLLLCASLLPACSKSSDRTNAADGGEAKFAEPPPDPLAELAQLEGRMRELGLEPPPVRTEVPVDTQQGAVVEEKVGEASDDTPVEKAEDRRDEERIEGTAVQPAPSEPPPIPMSEREDYRGESRCTSVCELSEAICELEVRICTMAKNHGSDATYVDACERAVEDCELSGNACDTCVE